LIYRDRLIQKEKTMNSVPAIRILKTNDAPVLETGDFVLYWMIAGRRTGWNYGLQRSADWAAELGKPLVVFEALRVGYEWASDRFHRFIIDGMAENAHRLKKHNVLYYPYLEPSHDEGKGLLSALAERACVIVTDDFPAFFLPRMTASASEKLRVLLEKVDSNGLVPMRATDKVYPTAFSFRRYLQKELPSHLGEAPKADPLKGVELPEPPRLSEKLMERWPFASASILEGDPTHLASFPIDHQVGIVERHGGAAEAERTLQQFLDRKLSSYLEYRNHPDEDGTSGLSPYLHFGHISVHQVLHELAEKEDWFPDRASRKATGKASGWWGMSEAAEAFLDQLITWREVGYNMCSHTGDYDQYESLPGWALKTLKDHEKDRRSYLYSLQEFEQGNTHDALWNAAQMQLVREGRIHNYLRMLWGKKILEWTATPREALKVMIELNDKYALDGRDPNSYSGIMWILGRYDRPWGPERSVFGKVRYMSSENTARKVRVAEYMSRYVP
jgi:deoxyribodipyrimidine photo-lyase